MTSTTLDLAPQALAPQPRRLTSAMHRKKKAVGHKLGDEAVVVTATGLVSVLNYGYTLILLWLLPTREFAAVSSISALLLICGTVAGAALPWVLAQEVLRSKRDRPRRRLAVTFCLFATVLQGTAAGLATCLIAAHYASGPVLIAAFASVFLIFMAATAAGYFQGLQSFRLIACLRVGEVVVKVGAGVGLVALGAGASGAIAGFALGAGLVAAGGLVYMVHDMEFSKRALAGRNLWASTQGLLAIQAGVAVLASMDVVIGSLILGAQPALATYQAANIIGRIPVFIGSALSMVVFPRMVAQREEPSVVIQDSVKLYAKLCVPICLIVVTLPGSITSMLFPARYGDVGAILPWTAAAGLMMGVVNLTTTYFQATGLFRRATKLLAAGVALGVTLDVFGLEKHGIVGLAIAVTIGATVVTALLLREIARTWSGSLRGLWRSTVVVAVSCAPLVALRRHEGLWLLWSLGVLSVFSARGLLAVARAGGGGGGAGGSGPGSGGGGPVGPPRPKVLHLGYEDPRRPGAGGGSVRTHEINQRLADRYDITVVCARYRGCRPRVEDGVHYVHSGVAGGGDFVERLAYFATLPVASLRYRSNLVVEDFGAPFSSVAVPWMTRRPVVGVVQWLFAAEKSKQYHLPFSWVETIGVRSHRRLVAVSDDLGATLAKRNPAAEVTVIANGLDEGAFASYDVARSGIGYLGRLEIAQKGLDLLLESYARIGPTVVQDLYLAGDGPDRQALVELAARLGIADRVHFVGRVPADERFEWLAGCDLVAMPSRYETFGMVAAESLAVRTPVVAFDIACLRALVDNSVGARVEPFDVAQFAAALEALATSPDRRRRLGEAGPSRVAGLNWDELANAQSDVYAEMLQAKEKPRSAARGRGDNARSRPVARPVLAPVGLSVVEQLLAQLLATPSSPAVVDGSVTWSYEELHRAAETAVDHLSIMGVEPGQPVGVCLPRSKEAIAAMIGIWSLGAVYVPLDPDYPAARLIDLCGRAGVSVAFATRGSFIAEAPGIARIDPSVMEFPIRAAVSGGVGFATARTRPLPTLDSPAYVLFTSGSSGQPKGVQVPHRGLATVLQWVRTTLSPEELASTATTISFSFDPFILEVLGPLVTGGVVHVIPSALALADRTIDATMLANTPSVLTELLRAGRLPSTLKTIISGGENLSGSLATELLSKTSITKLINTYGPTESTVLATAHEVTGPVSGPVPIGRPLPGAAVVLLDDEDREVGRGEKGEICIYGPQLADGYVGDPVDTDRRFVSWTDSKGSAVRIYRSGDLGRRDRRGVITFCGRKDRQLKLRGFRIEPGEIEATLAGHPAIGQAFVTSEGSGARASLVAYVTTESEALSSQEVRQWLGRSLPQFMVPAQFVMMPAFPVTANGKLEVERLPVWREQVSRITPSISGAEEDGDDARVRVVARLAGDIIGFDGPISGVDDFFDDLGGSSLGLFQLLSSLEKEFGCIIEIGRVLEDTTIAGVAAMVGAVGDEPLYLSVNGDGSKAPIYMIHAYLGTALRYRRLGQYLPADRPLVGIQVQAFDGESVPTRTTIDELAAEAVTQIRALQPHGPYVVGGHSAGGLVAYETARRLAADGEELPLVVLLDSPVPRSSFHYVWAESVMNWPDIKAASFAERAHRLMGLVTSRRGKLGGPTADDRVDATITRSYRSSNQAVKHYRPGPYDGDVAVLRTKQGMSMAIGKGDLGWAPYVSGQLTTVEIPGLHNTIFEDAQLEVIGTKLSLLLDSVEPPMAITAEVVAPAERMDGSAMVDLLMADAASIEATLADFDPGALPLPSVLRPRRSKSRPKG